MAVLDDHDAVSILSGKINQVINRQDGHSAIAALAITLSAALALAASKQPWPEAQIVSDLRAELVRLAAAMVKARDARPSES
jgi:hypothetical protein